MDWACVKEVLRWIVTTEEVTVSLPECKLQDLRGLLAIPTTPKRMGRKLLDNLVGKLCSMHLAVPGAVAHLYHLQRVMAQGAADRACLSPEFHRNSAGWWALADHTAAVPPQDCRLVGASG